MSLNHISAIGLAVMLFLTGCLESDDIEELTEVNESGENILGCTYESADNFQSNATVDARTSTSTPNLYQLEGTIVFE